MANEAVRFLRGTWTNYWKTAPTQDASTKKYNYSQAATNYKDCIYFCITGGSTLTADIKNAGVILLNCAPYTLNEDELKTYIETVKLNVNNGLSKITETSGEGIKFTPLLFADQDKDASANIITKNDIITNILYTGGKNIYANVNNAALYLQSLNAYTSIYAGNTITIGGLGNTISATTTGAEYKYYRKMSASSTIDKGIVYDIDNLKIYSELHESNGKTAYINLNNNSNITLSSGNSIKNIAPNILFNFGTSYSSAPNYVELRPNNDISVYTQSTLGISSYDSSISVSHNLVANISTATIGTTNMIVNTSKGSAAFNDYSGTSISGTQLILSSTKTVANNTTNNPNVVLKLKNNKTTGINFNDDFVMTYDHDTSSMILHHGSDIFTKIKKESVNNAWYNSILPNGNVRIGSNSDYFNDGAFLQLHSVRSISTSWDAYDSSEFVTKSAVESVLPTLGSMRHKGIVTIDTYATKLSGKHFVGDSYIVSGDIDAIDGKNGDIIVANDVALENSASTSESAFTDSTYVAAHWNLIRLVNSNVIMHDGDNKNETWTSGTVPIVAGTGKNNKSPIITDSSYSVLQSVSGSLTYVISGKSGSSSSSTLFNNTGNAQDIHDKLIPTLGILDYYKNQIVSDASSAYMQYPKYVLNNYASGNPTNYLAANRNTMGYIYEAPISGNSGVAPNTVVHYGNTQSSKNVSLDKARIFAIAGKSGDNDSSYMSGIINTDDKWFVTTSLHDYRDSYEVGTTKNIYMTSASGTYYKSLTVFDNNIPIPNYNIITNSLSGVEKIIIAGNATPNEFISYRSGGQKLYLPKPDDIDTTITNTFVISQDISTMATTDWVTKQQYAKQDDIVDFITADALYGYARESWVLDQHYITSHALSGYAKESWVTNKGYITSDALSGYAKESWVTNKGYITSDALNGYVKYDSDIVKARCFSAGDTIAGGGTTYGNGWVQAYQGFIIGFSKGDGQNYHFAIQEDIDETLKSYATTSSLSNYITSTDLNDYATQSWVNNQGFAYKTDLSNIDGDIGKTQIGTTTGGPYYILGSSDAGLKTEVYINASGAYWSGSTLYSPSDRRLKTDIKKVSKKLVDKIFDASALIKGYYFKNEDTSIYHYGFIAQDLKKIIPDTVNYNEDTDKYAVDYMSALSAVSGALIEKVKEQDKTIKKQDTKIKSLEERLSKLEKLISEKFKD